MENKDNLVDIIRLIRTDKIGSITFVKLIEQFGSAKNAIEFLPNIMKASNKSFNFYSKDSAIKEIELAQAKGIEIIPYNSPFYPPLLRSLEDFPAVLFAKGNLNLLKKTSVAVVGSRNASLLGKQNAFNFAKALGENGFLVISGLAKGIDTSAHEGSLEKGTVAVLGCGVDVVYPKENKNLYERICKLGLVLSEFPIGTQAISHNFPKRNRIISGVSRGVLVVEASTKSGSIITAKMALDQGREVFAIPGSPGDMRSKGANSLIKDGAILVDSISDIVNMLKNKNTTFSDHVKNILTTPIIKLIPMKEEELFKVRQYMLEALSSTPIPVDLLMQESGFSYNEISLIILELELSGKLERHPNNKVSLINTITE